MSTSLGMLVANATLYFTVVGSANRGAHSPPRLCKNGSRPAISQGVTLGIPPFHLCGVSNPGGGSRLPGIIFTRPKNVARPAQLQKKHCPCILEGRLTTNPILSALHLQGLISNIYVHFQVVSKQLIGISSWKLNHQWSMKLTWRSKTLLNPH